MPNDSKVYSLLFGILFNHSFRILDHWGSIADDILYNNNYFSKTYFSNITNYYTTERQLDNPNTNNFLKLTANNLIYRHAIQKDFETEFIEFESRIKNYLLPNIIKEYNLISRRLGIVYTYELNGNGIDNIRSKYFKPEVKGITDFRFSKRVPLESSRLWADKNDYVNKIFTIGDIEDERKGISYDYQLHFIPASPDIREVLPKFFENSKIAFNDDIIKV